MNPTPLLSRIKARRKLGRIGPVSPVSPVPMTDRLSPFMRRLIEKRLVVKEFRLGSFVPDGSDGAA